MFNLNFTLAVNFSRKRQNSESTWNIRAVLFLRPGAWSCNKILFDCFFSPTLINNSKPLCAPIGWCAPFLRFINFMEYLSEFHSEWLCNFFFIRSGPITGLAGSFLGHLIPSLHLIQAYKCVRNSVIASIHVLFTFLYLPKYLKQQAEERKWFTQRWRRTGE